MDQCVRTAVQAVRDRALRPGSLFGALPLLERARAVRLQRPPILAESVGWLIFDTSAQGAGVKAFQPVEIASGAIILGPGSPDVRHGDTMLCLRIVDLPSGDPSAAEYGGDAQAILALPPCSSGTPVQPSTR